MNLRTESFRDAFFRLLDARRARPEIRQSENSVLPAGKRWVTYKPKKKKHER